MTRQIGVTRLIRTTGSGRQRFWNVDFTIVRPGCATEQTARGDVIVLLAQDRREIHFTRGNYPGWGRGFRYRPRRSSEIASLGNGVEPSRRGDDRPRIRDRKLQAMIVAASLARAENYTASSGRFELPPTTRRPTVVFRTAEEIFTAPCVARISAKCHGESE